MNHKTYKIIFQNALLVGKILMEDVPTLAMTIMKEQGTGMKLRLDVKHLILVLIWVLSEIKPSN